VRFPHSVTVIRAPLVADGKGNQRRDWSAATSTTTPAWVQPVSSDEQNLNQERVVSRWRIFLPPTADVTATDRLTHGAVTYQVDGEVQTWDSGSGSAHHREAMLLRVVGG
jgi:hypothetical protein